MRCFVFALLALLAACGGGIGTDPDEVPDIDGTWHVSYHLSHAQLQVNCEGAGTATLQQYGRSFSGRWEGEEICTDGASHSHEFFREAITGGEIDNSVFAEVRFSTTDCALQGFAGSGKATRMYGDIECADYTFTGDWEFTR